MEYEIDAGTTKREKRFGWNIDMALKDMITPVNMEKIRNEAKVFEYKHVSKTAAISHLLMDLF